MTSDGEGGGGAGAIALIARTRVGSCGSSITCYAAASADAPSPAN